MIGLRRRLRRIKQRRGGVAVQVMGIGMEEGRFDPTRGGAPYPPILRVDDNFETKAECVDAACRLASTDSSQLLGKQHIDLRNVAPSAPAYPLRG